MGIYEQLDTCGIMFFIYSLSRLLDYWRQSLAFDDTKPQLQRFLNVCRISLWVLSAPVAIIMFGLNYMHNGLSEARWRREDIDRCNKSCANCTELIIAPLKKENKDLKDKLLDISFTSRDEGYKSGFQYGYRHGYREGFADCLEKTDLLPDKKRELTLESLRMSEYLSKELLKEFIP